MILTSHDGWVLGEGSATGKAANKPWQMQECGNRFLGCKSGCKDCSDSKLGREPGLILSKRLTSRFEDWLSGDPQMHFGAHETKNAHRAAKAARTSLFGLCVCLVVELLGKQWRRAGRQQALVVARVEVHRGYVQCASWRV